MAELGEPSPAEASIGDILYGIVPPQRFPRVRQGGGRRAGHHPWPGLPVHSAGWLQAGSPASFSSRPFSRLLRACQAQLQSLPPSPAASHSSRALQAFVSVDSKLGKRKKQEVSLGDCFLGRPWIEGCLSRHGGIHRGGAAVLPVQEELLHALR